MQKCGLSGVCQAVAALKSAVVVGALPKTRSGKILRNVLRSIADGEPYTLPGTIEDASVVDIVLDALSASKDDAARARLK